MSTFIISLILIFIISLIVRSMIKQRHLGNGCGGGCAGCKGCQTTKNDLYKKYHQKD